MDRGLLLFCFCFLSFSEKPLSGSKSAGKVKYSVGKTKQSLILPRDTHTLDEHRRRTEECKARGNAEMEIISDCIDRL